MPPKAGDAEDSSGLVSLLRSGLPHPQATVMHYTARGKRSRLAPPRERALDAIVKSCESGLNLGVLSAFEWSSDASGVRTRVSSGTHNVGNQMVPALHDLGFGKVFGSIRPAVS